MFHLLSNTGWHSLECEWKAGGKTTTNKTKQNKAALESYTAHRAVLQTSPTLHTRECSRQQTSPTLHTRECSRQQTSPTLHTGSVPDSRQVLHCTQGSTPDKSYTAHRAVLQTAADKSYTAHKGVLQTSPTLHTRECSRQVLHCTQGSAPDSSRQVLIKAGFLTVLQIYSLQLSEHCE